MKKFSQALTFILFVFLGLFLCSCGLSTKQMQALIPAAELNEQQLLNIKIQSRDELRFSGLIALVAKKDGLRYILMDASGVKLLFGHIQKNHRQKTLYAIPAIQESGLVSFLATSLSRIYLESPNELPCSQEGLNWFCLEKKEQWLKYEQRGPVVLWSASYHDKPKNLYLQAANFHQHMLDIQINLKIIK